MVSGRVPARRTPHLESAVCVSVEESRFGISGSVGITAGGKYTNGHSAAVREKVMLSRLIRKLKFNQFC